jgi:hypothetical protein
MRTAGIRNSQSPRAIALEAIPLIIFRFPDLHFAIVSIIWNRNALSSEIASRAHLENGGFAPFPSSQPNSDFGRRDPWLAFGHPSDITVG